MNKLYYSDEITRTMFFGNGEHAVNVGDRVKFRTETVPRDGPTGVGIVEAIEVKVNKMYKGVQLCLRPLTEWELSSCGSPLTKQYHSNPDTDLIVYSTDLLYLG